MRRVEEEEAKLLVHVVGHEGARKLGNDGDGELGCGVHGGGVQECTLVARERGRASEGEWRSSSAWFEEAGARVHASAMARASSRMAATLTDTRRP